MAKKYDGVLAEKLPPGLDGLSMLPERWVALYQHYGLDHTNRDHDSQLILAMAHDHVPGFQMQPPRLGKQHLGNNRVAMALMALEIVRQFARREKLSVLRSARKVAKDKDPRLAAEDGRRVGAEALRGRFYDETKRQGYVAGIVNML